MSHPDPLQEHYTAEEILDDRRSTREQLEQEIEETTELLVSMARIYGATIARLQDELNELNTD